VEGVVLEGTGAVGKPLTASAKLVRARASGSEPQTLLSKPRPPTTRAQGAVTTPRCFRCPPRSRGGAPSAPPARALTCTASPRTQPSASRRAGARACSRRGGCAPRWRAWSCPRERPPRRGAAGRARRRSSSSRRRAQRAWRRRRQPRWRPPPQQTGPPDTRAPAAAPSPPAKTAAPAPPPAGTRARPGRPARRTPTGCRTACTTPTA
jgi:hypothetical protein